MTDREPQIDPPFKPAGRHGPSIALFLCVTVGCLAADLIIKQQSFAKVTDQPIVLQRDDAGEPQVYLRNADGELVFQERRQPQYPASAMPIHEGIVVVPSVLNLQLTINTGAVFGMGKGGRWFFIAVSIAAIVIIGRFFATSGAGQWAFHFPLAMILSGALGNLYDRVCFAAVRDMFHLFPDVPLPFDLAWPGGVTDVYPWIFNFADAALVVGVIWLLPRFLFAPKSEEDEAAKS